MRFVQHFIQKEDILNTLETDLDKELPVNDFYDRQLPVGDALYELQNKMRNFQAQFLKNYLNKDQLWESKKEGWTLFRLFFENKHKYAFDYEAKMLFINSTCDCDPCARDDDSFVHNDFVLTQAGAGPSANGNDNRENTNRQQNTNVTSIFAVKTPSRPKQQQGGTTKPKHPRAKVRVSSNSASGDHGVSAQQELDSAGKKRTGEERLGNKNPKKQKQIEPSSSHHQQQQQYSSSCSDTENEQRQANQRTTKALKSDGRMQGKPPTASSIFRQNYWDANACHENLEIIGNKSLVVNYKKNSYDAWRSVFAKYSILLNKDSSSTFYYEVLVKNKNYWFISFGFTVKQQAKLVGIIQYEKGIYAYESDGKSWSNGKEKGSNYENSYGVGDTVGMGINWATRQLFFTKNGLRLGFSDLLVDTSFADDSFHPFLTLGHSDDKIEANFGPIFKFDLETL